MAARLCIAMRNFVWLLTYVAVMRLLGYRIPRPPAGPKPAQAIAPAIRPAPATPPTPRVKHRYLDRAMCLNLLADINSAFAPAPPIDAQPGIGEPDSAQPAITEPGDTSPQAPASAPRPAHPERSNRHATALILRGSPVRAALAPPIRKKSAAPPTQTHALFVAIS